MFIKRCFDLLFVVPGLIVLAPLFLIIAICIKQDSPGPVFFRQVRVARFGKLFRIYKFRTMVTNAEAIGSRMTVGEDCRITRFGKFLRQYKLDELPQLLNVLKGEMSLVGPRPPLPSWVEIYPQDIRGIVLSVPPGITDYASVVYKDESRILGEAQDPEEAYREQILPVKLAYCVSYVNERSLLLDFKLIIITLLEIMRINVFNKSFPRGIKTESMVP